MKLWISGLLILFVHLNLLAFQGFAPVGATWSYGYNVGIWNPELYSLKVQVTHDTIVEGKLCSYLKLSHRPSFLRDYMILLSENNKVYYHEADGFHILYDFNLEVGDSLTVDVPWDFDQSLSPGNSITLTVSSMDQIEINGQTRKVWQLIEPGPYSYFFFGGEVIEGIGSIENWLFPRYPSEETVYTNLFYGLWCYEDDLLGLYKKTAGECYIDTADIETSSFNPIDTLFLYPNPGKNWLHIDGVGYYEMAIYNICGQLISQENITLPFSKDVGDFPIGLYMLEFRQEGKPTRWSKWIRH